MASRPLGKNSKLNYKVETTWPDTSCPEKADEFGSYFAHAYTDIRDPGHNFDKILINTQKELFDKRSKSPYGGIGESLHFDKFEDAVAVAQFLQKWGRMSAGWSPNSQEEHQKQRRGPLKVRIVEEYEENTRTLMDFEDATPVMIDYLTELKELNKRYGIE